MVLYAAHAAVSMSAMSTNGIFLGFATISTLLKLVSTLYVVLYLCRTLSNLCSRSDV